MKYGYVRVSTQTQNVARQMEEMYKLGLTDDVIFVDRQSGKDFDRTSYKILKSKLKQGDLLIIKSIDRLGRNYDMIINEWQDITKVIDADIFVIDFPLLDTRVEGKNLVGKFISDIVLQVLSFVAQNERENIRQRQAEGIKIAKANGVHMGPCIERCDCKRGSSPFCLHSQVCSPGTGWTYRMSERIKYGTDPQRT